MSYPRNWRRSLNRPGKFQKSGRESVDDLVEPRRDGEQFRIRGGGEQCDSGGGMRGADGGHRGKTQHDVTKRTVLDDENIHASNSA